MEFVWYRSFFCTVALITLCQQSIYARQKNPLVPGSVEASSLSTGDHGAQDLSKPGQAWVRIPVKLMPRKGLDIKTLAGEIVKQYTNAQAQNYTLRAKIQNPNHFYFGEWHILTEPLSFNQKNRQLKIRLSFARFLDLHSEVEESLGTLEMTGILRPKALEDQPVFELMGELQKSFTNARGEELLSVEAGFPFTIKDAPLIGRSQP